MNIFSINPLVQAKRNEHIGLTNKSYIDNSLFISKDTVSFGAGANVRKLIEEFKQMDPAGNYDVKSSDIVKIYEYFGFKLIKCGSSHSRLVGPYGQTTSVVTARAKANAGAASDLIRALKRADDFEGELIPFEGEPSQEKIEEWKEILKTRTPNPDQVNQYAIDLKARREQTQEEQAITTKNTESKSTEIKIANAKAQIQSVIAKLDSEEKSVNTLKQGIKELQDYCKETNVPSIEPDLKNLLTKAEETEKSISLSRETVNAYSKQVNNGYPLSKENEETLNSIGQTIYNTDGLKKELTELEAKFLSIQEQKELLQEGIEEVVIDSKIFTDDINSELQKISSKMNDPAVKPFLNKSKIETIENLIQEIRNEIKIQNRQISKYENINHDNYTKEELEEIKTSLEKSLSIRENYAQEETKSFAERLMTKLNALQDIYKNEIAPLSDLSPDEIAQSRSRQVEKFNKKYKRALDEREKEEAKAERAAGEKETKHSSQITPAKPETISQASIEKQPAIQEVDGEHLVEETANVSKNGNIGIFAKLDANKQQMISKLAQKISPLPLEAVTTAITNELANNFDFEAFSSIDGDKNKIKAFISEQIKAFSKTPEFSRIKNATKYALISELNNKQTKPNEKIYDLNKTEMQTLFEELKAGKTNITITTQTSDEPIKIVLKDKINLNKLNSTFEKYNIPISEKQKNPNWEQKVGNNIVDEMLKNAPEFTQKELQSFLLSVIQEGSYLEILVDDKADDSLKLNVLKNFWNQYDAKNGSSFCDDIVAKFENLLKQKNEAQQQQLKLDSIDLIDWTL